MVKIASVPQFTFGALNVKNNNSNSKIRFASQISDTLEISGKSKNISFGTNYDDGLKKYYGECLIDATLKGDLKAVKKIIKARKDVIDFQNEFGTSALMCATCRNDAKMVKFLIKSGANPEIEDNVGDVALSFAATFGDVDVAKLLLDAGANKYHENKKHNTPTDAAIKSDNLEMIQLFNKYD